MWSWSGRQWEPVTDSGPAARALATAAYDHRRNFAVFTGGLGKSTQDTTYRTVADTWLGSGSQWQRLTGADMEPRDHLSSVFDEGRGTVVVFGGIHAERSWPSSTWELQPDGWRRIATEGPAGRGRTAISYDSRRGQIVLFGGGGEAPSRGQAQPFFGDTWLFESGTWRRSLKSGPRARYAHAMVFDERAGVTLLYGGSVSHRGPQLADLWQWNGEEWTEIQLSGPTPGPRYQPLMVYDRARGRTVLYGGSGEFDTWEWDGREWKLIVP